MSGMTSMQALTMRALAKGVLEHVHGAGHTLDCAAMVYAPHPDGGRSLVTTADDLCDCRHREANEARSELRALAAALLRDETTEEERA